jgi:hypothetical protein
MASKAELWEPKWTTPHISTSLRSARLRVATETKILTAAPAEKPRLQERAEVLRDWLMPKSTIPLST